ncbi:MAG: DUF4350 domain-containing protein [Gemmatimonadaceae bacterium]
MTTTPAPKRARDWWTKPGVVLPVVASVVILVGLLTPQASAGRLGDSRLSSHLAGSLGARIFGDLATKLGWTVQRRDSVSSPHAPEVRTIHAVMAPSRPVTREDAHRYLESVRAGGALLYVLDSRTPLSDSLGVTHFVRGGVLPSPVLAGRECPSELDFTPPLWADNRVHVWGVRWLRGAPIEREVFATLERDDGGPPVPGDGAVGFAYGRGRVVVVGDPDLLRNDVLRRCRWGADVIAVRMLEYLRDGGPAPRLTLAFDEFHHGYGSHPGSFDVILGFLFVHPLGRAIAVLVLAAIVLLLAAAPRALPPVDVERVERRDPLEQVDALAHAYEQVRATRTATARLLRGVRWRAEHARAVAWARTDEEFLDTVTRRAPARGGDVALVKQALEETITDRELPGVGEALQRIEHSLTTS